MNDSGHPNIDEFVSGLSIPSSNSVVYREECTQCFESQDSPQGIDVCLSCFNGGCLEPGFQHATNHARKTGHRLALNVRRIKKDSFTRAEEPPPLKKLAILEDSENDRFELKTSIKFYPPGCDRGKTLSPDQKLPPTLETVIAATLASSSSAQANEVKAWEEEIKTCSHVTNLEQQLDSGLVLQESSKCHACELSSNLWLCLRCGSLGCGRAQYGGIGGNGHALQHYQSTGHAVNVKLGTITAEGSADLYCYQCDDARTDEKLQFHLAHFGIEIAKQEKTEKSMTELQVEHNMKFDFSLSDKDGNQLIPVCGPGLTGLQNLGNSCYMASVLQVLFDLPPFKERYYRTFERHAFQCEALKPAECHECQMTKIAHGLLSGRYAITPDSKKIASPNSHSNSNSGPMHKEGIKPMMFKALIGRGHPEFSTMRQQDADEFMRHLFQVIQRQSHQNRQILSDSYSDLCKETPIGDWLDPTLPFRFELEQRLQCVSCKGVRYTYEEQDALSIPVPAIPIDENGVSDIVAPNGNMAQFYPVSLEECMECLVAPQTVEYTCPLCAAKTGASTTSRFASFPRYLFLHARRFALVNWVPTKLEVPLIINEEVSLDSYHGTGLKPDEQLLPDNVCEVSKEPPVNPETIAALESMGFLTARCRTAIIETGNSGVETAMNWLFEHVDEPDIVEVVPQQRLDSFNPSDVSALEDMGFTSNQAKKALSETAGQVERAVEWLFSHPDDDGSSLSIVNESSQCNSVVSGDKNERNRLGDRNLPAKYRLRAFISHKGPSVHSGHYVSHILKSNSNKINAVGGNTGDAGEDEWVFFNDEVVARVKEGSLSAKSLSP
ncbi:hypothetical protein BY996DRAFT_4585560 [Phakopsora pachyrhizi]|nr:hypothetical protein BY996DRAFT_4585560 [Phakopsora pachyrhizi]